MTVRSYLWGMRLGSLAALICFGLVINFIDPTREGVLGQTLFYITLFFSITGLATLFLFWLCRILTKEEVLPKHMAISFRQGFLIALAVSGMFLLQSFRLLVWWDAGMVIAGVFLLELWLLSK